MRALLFCGTFMAGIVAGLGGAVYYPLVVPRPSVPAPQPVVGKAVPLVEGQHSVAWWLEHRDPELRAIHRWCLNNDPSARRHDCQTSSVAWDKWEAENMLQALRR